MLKTIIPIVKKSLPKILLATGISGFVVTAILSAKETPRYLDLKAKENAVHKEKDGFDKFVSEGKIFIKAYYPAIITGTAAAFCILESNSINAKRQAAALAAYSISESKLKNYKDAVIKTVGEKKAKAVGDSVAEEYVRKNPPKEQQIIFTGNGDHLCYDAISGRYFKSSIEKVRQAANRINYSLMSNGYVPLNEFYDELGLSSIKIGENLGWSVHGFSDMVEINFSSQLTDDGAPCLVLDYSVEPRYFELE